MRTIIAATDLSARSAQVLGRAVSLARDAAPAAGQVSGQISGRISGQTLEHAPGDTPGTGMRIILVHVIEPEGFSARRALRLKGRSAGTSRSAVLATLEALAAAFGAPAPAAPELVGHASHASPGVPDAAPHAMGVSQAMGIPGGAQQQHGTAAHTRHAGPQIDCIVAEGPPEAALSALVEETGADLLILGLHKERRVLDALRLSTMERILLASDCPVLIAHQPPDRPYATVLGAVDFGPASARALVVAGQLAPNARFYAIHALHQPLRDKFSPGDPDDTTGMIQAGMLRRAFCQTPGLPAALHTPEIIPGSLYEVLMFRLDELRPDLLTIGTQSNRIEGALGHYARDLMRAPPTDMLIARPG